MDKYSSCCGAGVDVDRLICLNCKEHCGVEETKEEIYCRHCNNTGMIFDIGLGNYVPCETEYDCPFSLEEHRKEDEADKLKQNIDLDINRELNPAN